MTMARTLVYRCSWLVPAVAAFVDQGTEFLPQNNKTGNGKSLQIFHVAKTETVHKYELNEHNLEKVLLHPEVKDRPVVVMSVAGASRKGKSFLLGFFLKYLESQSSEGLEGDSEWLNGNDEIQGFEWRGGVKPVTSGIEIWSKPFICCNQHGDEVAVLLMDTQGIFDSDMTVKDSVSIFALNILMSSIQVYNIMQQVKEDDLQNLELFTEYGRMVNEMSENSIANQTRLVFLIRDWAYACDYPFGEQGGNAYILDRLKSEDSQHQELKRLRKNITSCFSNIDGFLLPHPGNAVAVQHSSFCVLVNEMDSDFIRCIKELMPYIIFQDMLVPKTIGNMEIKGKDLFKCIKVFVNYMNRENIPPPRAAFETKAFGTEVIRQSI